MIRWRFVLTRLIVTIAIIVLLGWGLSPIAKYITVRSLESVTGAKVEIAETSIGLFPPRLHYGGVAIADPRSEKSMRDLLRADSIDLVIDGDALLRRRWVASKGEITGLQVGASRQSSGHYQATEGEEPESASDSPSVLGKLFAAATGQVGDQAEAIAQDLETVKRGKQIRDKWEAEYAALVTRARDLEKQIRSVRDEARGIENPLRDWPALEQTLEQARQARNELMSVRQAIDSLPERLQADMRMLDEAKRIDLAKVDRYVPGDLSEADDLGIDIVSQAVREQVSRVREYWDGGRKIANYTVVAPESDRVRGVDHDLDRLGRPAVLIRQCKVDGLMRADGDSYTLTGTLENVTPTPELLAEPTRARFRLEGPETVRVEYIKDRRRGSNIDLVTLHWPQTEAPSLRLGNDHDAGITIDGGQRELWVQLHSEGERVRGRMVSKQTGMKMDLHIAAAYEDTAAAKALRESLSGVDVLEIDANFNGTWGDFDLNLNTNLAQVFQNATRAAIDSQLRESRALLTAQVEQAHAAQAQSLQKWLGDQQSEARSLLASADQSIEEMSQKVLDEVGDADAYLGKLRTAIRGRLK